MSLRWRESEGGLGVDAPAKINLYLEILGPRSDGFHEIDTLMQAVSLADELEFRAVSDPGVVLEVDSAVPSPAPPAGPDNLVTRAAQSMLREARRLGREPRGGVSIRLRKRVPMGAGLGGGSSDAAVTLLALDRWWGLGLGAPGLERLASELGSDVAFFLYGGLGRCRGRGEEVTPVAEMNAGEMFSYVLVSPGFEVPTALIYKRLKASWRDIIGLTSPEPLATMGFAAIRKALEEGWLFRNRLQEVAFTEFPELRRLHELIEAEPFRVVQMTGSGATLFGVCQDTGEARRRAACLERRLREPFPAAKVYAVDSVGPWWTPEGGQAR